MPVAAVSIGGSPRVSSGSTIDHLGIMCGLIIANLRPLVMLIREPRPTSEPVPAVVGIAITGATAEVTLSKPPQINAVSSRARLCVAMIPIAFATSIGDPPPNAMIPSQASVRYISSPLNTEASVGFVSISENTAGSFKHNRSTNPRSNNPPSVTTKGRFNPTRSITSGKSANDPAPN